MAPIIFYHDSRSIPSRYVLMVFKSLDLDVQINNIDLWNNDQYKPEFIKKNPEHVVPTIDDNGFVLWESNAIAQYLVETYAIESSLYSKETKARAVVNQRLSFYNGTLLQVIKSIVVPIFKLEEKVISESKKETLQECFRYINDYLSEDDWVAGKNVTLADLAIFAAVSTIVSFGADISEYKHIVVWLKKCQGLPGFEENSDGVNYFTVLFKQLYNEKF